MKRYPCILTLINICITIILTACSHLSISKGEFDVSIPPSVSGAGKELDDNAVTIFDLNVNSRSQNTTNVNNMRSNGYEEESVPSFTVDGRYIINNSYGSIAISRYDKNNGYDNPMVLAFGGGFYPYPYVFIGAGPNFKNFECGLDLFLSLSNERAEFEGVGAQYNGGFISFYENGVVTNSGENIWHGNIGYGIYTSVYAKGIGLHYTGNLYYPWSIFNSLPGSIDYYYDGVDSTGSRGRGSENYDIDVSFPMLIIQKMDISYILKQTLRIKSGLGVVVGKDFAGRYWSKHIGLEYLF